MKFHKRYFRKYGRGELKKALSMRKVFTRVEGTIHVEELYIGRNFTQVNFKRYVLDTWKYNFINLGFPENNDWDGSEK